MKNYTATAAMQGNQTKPHKSHDSADVSCKIALSYIGLDLNQDEVNIHYFLTHTSPQTPIELRTYLSSQTFLVNIVWQCYDISSIDRPRIVPEKLGMKTRDISRTGRTPNFVIIRLLTIRF